MKTTNVIGLFRGAQKPGRIANSLRIAGFEGEDIVTEKTDSDVFLLSVLIKNGMEYSMAHNIFDFYHPHQITYLDLKIKTGEELRRLVDCSAKLEARRSEVRHHHHYHKGITTEVSFGRSQ